MSAAGNDNEITNVDNDNRTIFIIKDTKLFVAVVTLSARDNQKLSKLCSKGFERLVYWNEYKTRSDNKDTIDEIRFFLESNFVEVNRLFVLVYSNKDDPYKRFKAKRYYLPKEIINNYNATISEKSFYDQTIDSDIKWYEEIRKLTAGQGDDYTTGCLLDYNYIKIILVVDLSRQNELDADPKAIQQTEFVGQLKKLGAGDSAESMFILQI